MDFEYQFIINNNQPNTQNQGTFWFNQDTGFLYLAVNGYTELAIFYPLQIKNQIKWLKTYRGNTPPLNYEIGSIWIKPEIYIDFTINIYLNDWENIYNLTKI